ncbi:MAG: phosphoribosylglycinamide formyltransferase [Bdellovibrionota bacterium]
MSESKDSPRVHSPLRVVVLLSGRGSNFRALLTSAKDCDQAFKIVGVISDRPSALGLETARSAKIPTSVVERRANELSSSAYNVLLAKETATYKPDLVVLAGFMRVLKNEFIATFPSKVINIHPSLLPAFKGLNAQRQALASGAKFSGCTVHIASEEVDSGAIIAQAAVPIFPDDSEESLTERILRQEHRLLPAVVRAVALGEIELEPAADHATKVIYHKQSPLNESSFLATLVES